MRLRARVVVTGLNFTFFGQWARVDMDGRCCPARFMREVIGQLLGVDCVSQICLKPR